MFSRLFLARLSRALAAFTARLETKTRLYALLKWAEAHRFYSAVSLPPRGAQPTLDDVCGVAVARRYAPHTWLCVIGRASLSSFEWYQTVFFNASCIEKKKKREFKHDKWYFALLAPVLTCKGIVESYLT